MLAQNYVEYFEGVIKSKWDLPSMSNIEKEVYSYSDVGEKIIWLHNILSELGISRGDKVALVGKNSVNWAITYLAVTTYGAVIVPILPNFAISDMSHIIHHSDAKLLFIAGSIMDNLEEDKLNNLLGIINVDDFSLADCKIKPKNISEVESAFAKEVKLTSESFSLPQDICNSSLGEIIYTSGTTGFTKGVMLSLNSLITNVVVANEMLKFSEGSKTLAFLPLSHAYACAFDLLYPFSSGLQIQFIGKTPSAKLLLKHFRSSSPEMILSVPLILEKIIKKNVLPIFEKKMMKFLTSLPGVKSVLYTKIRNQLLTVFGGSLQEMIIGGAPLNHEVEKFLKLIKFPFTIGYGMSECGPLISYSSATNHKLGSSGKIVNYLQAKIDSPNPQTIPGNILVKGEQVMLGYYKNEEATKEVLSSDGWLNTGDIGTIDSENNVYIKGRSKSLVLGSAGENIYPEAVEQQFNNMELVQESLLLQRENKLEIHIYPDFDEADTRTINQQMFPEFMEFNRSKYNKKAPDYAKIGKVIIVAEPFQRTPTKKIKRYLYK